jgi:hypothetical protein
MSRVDPPTNGDREPSDWHRISDEDAVRLRLLNAELRRLLEKHQWSGITPTKSYGACPECGGSAAPFAEGHRPGCAIATALDASP